MGLLRLEGMQDGWDKPHPDAGRGAAASLPVPLDVAVIGTYVPRQCGIATFTSDLVTQLAIHHREIATTVYALDAAADGLAYDGAVRRVECGDRNAYAAAARAINESGADAVWLQHEFGIFGGPDGEMVCDLVDQIAAPLIVTFHTVLRNPGENQRRIVEHLIARASRIMVMSHHGRDLLIDAYRAQPELVAVIPHGAPDRPFGREPEFKERLGHAGRQVLMTFGLLGQGKGLEHVIEALPAIVSRHPDTVYRIVGATHPALRARDGEAYREGLEALARRLGVAGNIEWDNRFLEVEELLDQLEACDVYVTPYLNMQQATSGTLSYAVALGKAVVSTPYLHAAELLDDGVGVLVEPRSSHAIADAVTALLDDPARLWAMKRRAYRAGRATIWPRFAASCAALLRETAVHPDGRHFAPGVAPGLAGFFAMCDGTGMYQHAIGVVPNRQHGYCLDDNARALILMNRAGNLDPVRRMAWSGTFASFVQHAWNPDAGAFRNFMRFDRTWCEEEGSDDANGRAIWALGDTAELSPFPDMRAWAVRAFDETLCCLAETTSPRALAFGMLGACAILRQDAGHGGAARFAARGAELLQHLLQESRRPGWAWFETLLAYDNPRLPQALIEAGAALGRADWEETGRATLAWICARQTSAKGHFRAVGSETFGRHHDQLPFDQQPLEAQAAIEACLAACGSQPDQRWPNQRWLDHARAAFEWFLGRNDRGVALGDMASGRCRDGITPRGANGNCGAESILAFQLGYYAFARMAARNPHANKTGEEFAQPHRQPGRTTVHS